MSVKKITQQSMHASIHVTYVFGKQYLASLCNVKNRRPASCCLIHITFSENIHFHC